MKETITSGPDVIRIGISLTANLTLLFGLVAWNPPFHQTSVNQPVPSATPIPEIWRPLPGDRLQIQFTGGEVALLDDVDIYDLDLFETNESVVEKIHANGARAICYINAGAWEDWRPDANTYPDRIIGREYSGWPGEKWLDIRSLESLQPILSARMDLCRQKGFDGVEPDNLDGYQNDSGFPLTAEDQLEFNRLLATLAHAKGLSIGLKNDPDQMDALSELFDFVIVEDCFQYGWCDNTRPFSQARKPIFAIEYTDNVDNLSDFCPLALKSGITLMLKNRELDVFRQSCP